jgi:hypothetical protein
LENRDHEWKIGHLGHGLRSISLYDRRLFKPREADVPVVADRDEPPSAPVDKTAAKAIETTEKTVTKPTPQDNKQLGVDGQPERTSERPPKPRTPSVELFDL